MNRLYYFFYALILLAVGFSLGGCNKQNALKDTKKDNPTKVIEEPSKEVAKLPKGTYRYLESHQGKDGWYYTSALEITIYDSKTLFYYIGQSMSHSPWDNLRAKKSEFRAPCRSPLEDAEYSYDKQTNLLSLKLNKEQEEDRYTKEIKSIRYNSQDNTISVELKKQVSIFGDKLSLKLVHKEKGMWDGMDF